MGTQKFSFVRGKAQWLTTGYQQTNNPVPDGRTRDGRTVTSFQVFINAQLCDLHVLLILGTREPAKPSYANNLKPGHIWRD